MDTAGAVIALAAAVAEAIAAVVVEQYAAAHLMQRLHVVAHPMQQRLVAQPM